MKYVGLSMTELLKMPIRDRKAFIKKHNGEELKRKDAATNHGGSRTNNTLLMNEVARMKQEELNNMKNNSKAV